MNLVVGAGKPAEGMPSAMLQSISTREAVSADGMAFRSMASRLVPFGLPPWRDPRKALAIDIEAIGYLLRWPSARNALMIAVDQRSSLLGFIQVFAAIDRVSGTRVAQVARVVVVAGRNARATGNVLLASTGEWASAHDCSAITCTASWAMPVVR